MKRKIKAVIFDIDGSLINTELALYYLIKDTLRRYGEKKRNKEEILEPFGSSGTTWIKKLIPGIRKERLIHMKRFVAEQYAKHYMKRFGRPMPHASYILRELKKRNIKLAIATNQTKKQSKVALDIINFHKFNVVAAVDLVKNPKPAPDTIFYALKKLKAKKDEVLYIGDTMTDVKAAKAAGVNLYLVEHHYNKHIKHKKIKNLKEILKLIS
ncbi:MAG: HAD-IA family hydrolase [Candidatus Aenigmarchaeota archaeon]|nr:HAD-IA family hydrolase [Candidatus Aenigmarchaeota archaeon]